MESLGTQARRATFAVQHQLRFRTNMEKWSLVRVQVQRGLHVPLAVGLAFVP